MGKLIGIGGHLRSGKDTVADYLVENYSWTKMGMSDVIADALYMLNPWIGVNHDADGHPGGVRRYQNIVDQVGYVEAKTNREVRRLLQILGTEVGRKMIDEDVWTNILAQRIHEAQGTDQNIILTELVLTGVRYKNEIEMVHRLGGETWWIERPGLPREEEETVIHSSENSLGPTDFDLLIVNSGTLNQLYAQVERQLQAY
jgi:hypothetical protein